MTCYRTVFWVSLATYRIAFRLKETLRIIVNRHRKIPKEMIINHEVTRVVKDGENCKITNDKVEKFELFFFKMCKPWHSSFKAGFHLIATTSASVSLAAVAIVNIDISNHVSDHSNRCGIVWKPLSTDFSDHCDEKYTRVQCTVPWSKSPRASSLCCSDIVVVIATASRKDGSTFFGA